MSDHKRNIISSTRCTRCCSTSKSQLFCAYSFSFHACYCFLLLAWSRAARRSDKASHGYCTVATRYRETRKKRARDVASRCVVKRDSRCVPVTFFLGMHPGHKLRTYTVSIIVIDRHDSSCIVATRPKGNSSPSQFICTGNDFLLLEVRHCCPASISWRFSFLKTGTDNFMQH